jgi:ribosomal protein S18 acetylase RimI-like enzyme
MARTIETGVLWTVSESGRVLAFCHLEPEPELVWLDSIAVDPDCQARGLGKALAYRALEAEGPSPHRPAQLNVSSKNLAALAVYRGLGFAPNSEKRRFAATHADLAAALARRQSLR